MTTSTVAPLSASRVKKTESTSQDDSTNTNNFAILDRAGDRVQSSRINRRTQMTILNQFLYVSAL
eukprot:2561499-Pyramimonas_sp.AAC.1